MEARRLGFVLAAVPDGIVADGVDNDATPTPVAPRNLRGQRRQRHKRIHKVGVQFAPQPRVHAAHRGSHDEAGVIYSESLGE